MSRWMVQLVGDDSDLSVLQRLFPKGEHRVEKEGDAYYLLSDTFASSDDHERTRGIAIELVALMNGAAIVWDRDQREVKAGTVCLDDNGGRKAFLQGTCEVRSRFMATLTMTKADGTEVQPDPSSAEGFVLLAHHDKKVSKALQFFTPEHNWHTLYHVYEIIVADFKMQISKIERLGLASEGECGRFNRTANWYETHGGRHVVRKGREPDKLMSLDEAHEFVRRLLGRWLEAKLNRLT